MFIFLFLWIEEEKREPTSNISPCRNSDSSCELNCLLQKYSTHAVCHLLINHAPFRSSIINKCAGAGDLQLMQVNYWPICFDIHR